MAVRTRQKRRKPVTQVKLTYVSWNSMLLRCQYTKHVSFAEYGGRGIGVSPEWDPKTYLHLDEGFTDAVGQQRPSRQAAFERFIADLGLRPSAEHTLDRRDPNGHYALENVRWATHKEQGINKRVPAKMVVHPSTGAPIPAATLAAELGISYQQLRYRMVSNGTWDQLSAVKEVSADA